MLPRATVLGQLTVSQVIEFYDFPRIFTALSSTGQCYIVLSIFDDETTSDWLYLPVSVLRRNTILNGHMRMHEAFRKPEGGYLFLVRTSQDQAPHLEYLLAEQVPEDDLPSPDYVVTAAISEEETATVLPPKTVARATRRETFDYHIYPEEPHAHEIPAKKLGGILSSTQELIDALGQATDSQPTVRGPIATELLRATKINVTHVFRGSFGVQFSSAEAGDLLDDSILGRAISELSNLLQAGDSEDQLSNKLHALKGRVASKYRALLKALRDINSGIALDWGSVVETQGGLYSLTKHQVAQAYLIVDRIDTAMSEELTVSGKLIGFNSRTQRYEIQSSEDEKAYAGRVSDEASLEVLNPSIGEFYVARLRKLVETQSTSGDELVRWVLVGLSLRK